MEIQQLKGFVAVVQNGTFSGGAIATHRTQPAVSLQVQALEEEFGVELFTRIGKTKLVLTEEGKKFYELASPLLRDIESFPYRFGEAQGQIEEVPVRVATHITVMAYLLPPIVKEFRKRFPRAELSILSRTREEILCMVQHAEVDLGITSLSTVPSDLDYTVFFRSRRVLILPKKHALAKRKTITLEDLSECPLILPPRQSNTRVIIDAKFKEQGLSYRTAMEVMGREGTKAYVAMGVGASIVNDYVLSKADRTQLVIKDVSHLFGQAERGILVRKSAWLPEAVKGFMGMVRDT
jgi:DNA-binding transcriptional LysR family regulator